ncbi:hypothetical protein GJU43_14925 [Flavobacterium sp. LC2016-23]|uniref:DUF6712 family protein n=1 Tax=Flavobacterium sp. LC2016-23 TaxID=2666330 RepID=UPI0012B0A0EE|nr:DUF6712 family protein [Flavobacterium sp. LC2016-23]MRX40580.1 hypothetical protein [Flavobacterium sp. LC2016-23]
MILETTADLKKYVSVAQSFEFSDFQPYITKAINGFTKKYLGNLHVFLAEESGSPDISFEVKNEAREHLRNAIANFGMFIYFPFMSVMLDSSGATEVKNDQRQRVNWGTEKDIRRELLRSGHEAMDYLLELLEKNPSVFTDWTADFGTINKKLLVHNTASFNEYYHIFNSRQTFLALQPSIRQVEDQYLRTMLCPELIEHLKTDVSGISLEVKTELQKAIVAFTIAKVANVGLFLLDENGLKVNFDLQIDIKKESVSNGKTAEQVSKLVEEQSNNGSQYLALARQLIEENISSFDQCEFPLKKTNSTGSGSGPYDTTGVLAL